jgi:thiol:disulfide interchange protein DsbD
VRGTWFSGAATALCALSVTLASCPSAAPASEHPVTASSTASVERLRVGESADVAIKIDIAPGWHVNSNEPGLEFLIPTSVQFELPAGVRVVELRFPEPAVRRLKLGGSRDLKLYEGSVSIEASLLYEKVVQAAPEPVAVLRYQACNDTLCLRPASVRLPLPLKLSAIEGVALAGFNEEAADSIARLVAGGLWVVVPGMLVLGLALNLTPCVYPLMSVTIAYFGSQAGNRRAHKLRLALTYTFGIALTFSALGVSAAASGGLFGQALTNPWVLVGVAAVMVALALSCFGLYQVRIPSFLTSRIGRAARGGAGALFMGMTMGLVAAPCVAPVVVGLLVFVGTRGDLLLGLALFFLLALGLGIPYVALALAAGSIAKLPRSGAWLKWTEHLFGCILLAMALYFVQPVLPDPLKRLLMPVFLTLAVLYLAFLDAAGRNFRLFVLGRWLAGAAALLAIAFVYLPSAETQEMLSFEPFSAETYDRARRAGRPFVIEFGAEWCLPCREMEERTFTDPGVVRQ